uniref:Small integral membrane protein 20 n=1 Tax=Equus caballus TaxID=9796 RepID=A0A5F5Q4W6_HORSE
IAARSTRGRGRRGAAAPRLRPSPPQPHPLPRPRLWLHPFPNPAQPRSPPRLLAPPPRPGSERRSASSEPGHGRGGLGRACESVGRAAAQGRPRPGAMSGNLRTALIFGGFISLIGAAFYPIYFRPLMRLEEYQKEQAINRAGIVQEDVQPPGLKVWSDPFGRK